MSQNLTDEKQLVEKETLTLETTASIQPAIYCHNCGTALSGLYCHSCGQSSRNMIKYVGDLFREVLEDVIGYDSRLKHTLIPLLFKPGAITVDYIRGRRTYYVLPLRLYLISSLLLILLVKLNSEPTLNLSGDEQSQQILNELNDESQTELKKNESSANNIAAPITSSESIDSTAMSQSREKIDALNKYEKEVNKSKNIAEKDGKDFSLRFDGDDINFVGEEFQSGFLQEFAQEVQKKWRGWRKDPKPLFKQIIELLPYMMFILLPVFALFLKAIYGLSKRYYVEHLILLLHNHSFLYVALILEIGFDYIVERYQNSPDWIGRTIAEVADWSSTILMWWMAIYIILSMRKVYAQRWSLTLLKGGFLMFVYTLLISFGFISTILVGAFIA